MPDIPKINIDYATNLNSERAPIGNDDFGFNQLETIPSHPNTSRHQ